MENAPGVLCNLLDRPEFSALFSVLMDKLLSESGRGAVLIGTTYVDDQLTDFIQAILPDQTKKYREKLLNYPGPLSSFSSKIELLYAFRYIGKPFYDSLNALRKLRNEAAHSATDFSFTEMKEKFEQVFAFINPSFFIRNEALKMLLKTKIDSLKVIFEEEELPRHQWGAKLSELLRREDVLKRLEEEQLPHWQLILGLSLLCSFLAMKKDETLKTLGTKRSWGDQ